MAWLGKSATQFPALAKFHAAKYHLNDPLWVQYYYYVTNVFQGNFGVSPTRGFVPVLTVLKQTFPFTFQIAFFAIIISLDSGNCTWSLFCNISSPNLDRGIRAFYLAWDFFAVIFRCSNTTYHSFIFSSHTPKWWSG